MGELLAPNVQVALATKRTWLEQDYWSMESVSDRTGEVTPDFLRTLVETESPLGTCTKFVRQGDTLICGDPELDFLTIAAARGLMDPEDEGFLSRVSADSLSVQDPAIDKSLRASPNHSERPTTLSIVRGIAQIAGLEVLDKSYYRL